MTNIDGNNFIRLKGTDLKFDMSKLTQLKRTEQNASIFDKLDENKDGKIDSSEIQALYDAAGNTILSRREAKKAGWDFNQLKMFAKDQAAQIKAQTASTIVDNVAIEGLDNSVIDKANAMLKASSSTIEPEGIYYAGGVSTYRVTHNEDGGYTRTYEDGRIRNYDTNGKEIGGKLADGRTYTQTNNEDGSYVLECSDGQIQNYDANGRLISGRLKDGTAFTTKYANDGTNISEFTRTDGSKRYQKYDKNFNDTNKYAERKANGDIEADAISGETFDATMKRLGITDPADQEAFKKANPKAAKRGYFMVGMHDVTIPKAIADKLDMNNVVVDSDAQVAAWKNAVGKS